MKTSITLKRQCLQMNQLSVEKVAQRRGELWKMREPMFRVEESVAYRWIKRKEKDRTGKINDDDNEVEILKRELDRARERTLRVSDIVSKLANGLVKCDIRRA
jgi:U3 small nucleolar RNA-associated protein 14